MLLFVSVRAVGRRLLPAILPLVGVQVGGSPVASAGEPVAVVVKLADDSVMKVRLLDELLAVETPYGLLKVPARDIARIEFAPRLSERETREIEAAVADLIGTDEKKQNAARSFLKKQGARAVPALTRAAAAPNSEVANLLAELKDDSEDAPPPGHDLIVTAHSRFAGRLTAPSLRIATAQFGDKSLQVADIRSLRDPSAEAVKVAEDVLPGPQSLMTYQGNIGKAFAFQVTGMVGGSVWGSDTYTLDSSLPAAAVHAGALKVGETGVVRIKIVASPQGYVGSNRNGVMSSNYAFFPPGAFEVIVKKGK